jgi:hypothetical protein
MWGGVDVASDNRHACNQLRLARAPRRGLRGHRRQAQPATFASRAVRRSPASRFVVPRGCRRQRRCQRLADWGWGWRLEGLRAEARDLGFGVRGYGGNGTSAFIDSTYGGARRGAMGGGVDVASDNRHACNQLRLARAPRRGLRGLRPQVHLTTIASRAVRRSPASRPGDASVLAAAAMPASASVSAAHGLGLGMEARGSRIWWQWDVCIHRFDVRRGTAGHDGGRSRRSK